MPFLVLMLILSAAATTAHSPVFMDNMLNVTSLPAASGIYYQPTNHMQFVVDVWRFVIEVDHYIVFRELDLIQFEAKKLIKEMQDSVAFKNCTIANIVYSQINTSLFKEIDDLRKKFNSLDANVMKNPDDDETTTRGARRKRSSPLNFMGTAYKYVFGLMDSNDAEELHNLAKSSNSLNEQVKELTHEMLTLADYLKHKECVNAQRAQVCIYAEAKNNLLNKQLQDLYKLYNSLFNAVQDAKHGRLNDYVLTPLALKKAMQDVKGNLPQNMEWPVGYDQMHALIEHIIKVNVFVHERKFMFIVQVPLLNDIHYTLYHAVAVPYCDEHKCAIVLPESKYIGMSQDRRNYVRLHDDSMQQCIQAPDRLLCYKSEVVLVPSEDSLCDIKILVNAQTKINLDKDCDVRIGKFEHIIFYSIAAHNNWLYVVRADTALTLICNENRGSKTYEKTVLLRAGAGTIRAKGTHVCEIITPATKLMVYEIKSKYMSSINAALNTSFDLGYALKAINSMQVQSMKINTNLDHNLLKGMTDRLIDLQRRENNNTLYSGAQIGENENDNDNGGWNIFSMIGIDMHVVKTVIVWVVLGMLALFVYKIYLCCCPGTCTELCSFSGNTRNSPTVVRIDRELQYMKPPVNKQRDEDDDENDYYKKI